MYHFSCQYKGFLLYGFSRDLLYEERSYENIHIIKHIIKHYIYNII